MSGCWVPDKDPASPKLATQGRLSGIRQAFRCVGPPHRWRVNLTELVNGSVATGGTATGDTMFLGYPKKICFFLDNLGYLCKLDKSDRSNNTIGGLVSAKVPSRSRICTKSHSCSCPPVADWESEKMKSEF